MLTMSQEEPYDMITTKRSNGVKKNFDHHKIGELSMVERISYKKRIIVKNETCDAKEYGS